MTELDEKLLDHEWARGVIKYGIGKDYPGDSLKSLRETTCLLAEANLSILHRYSESPIETLFFSSLLIAFIKNFPLSCVFQPPVEDVEAAISEHRRSSEKAYVNPNTDRSPASLFSAQFGVLKYYHAFHVALQPSFKDFYGAGKNVRADALIWIPGSPQCRVVVECDGFQHHGGRDQFISDRKRDRVFADKGFVVRRYSGSEIVGNMIDASYDLFDYVTGAFKFGADSEAAWLERIRRSR